MRLAASCVGVTGINPNAVGPEVVNISTQDLQSSSGMTASAFAGA